MDPHDQVLNSSPAGGDGLQTKDATAGQRRDAERTWVPVPLSHQVAGHKYGTHNIGILQHFDGTILKQLQPPPRGPCELNFYKQVFAQDCADPHLLALQQHLPKYYGTWSTQDKPDELYLKLEDVTGRFAHPCIMDVKIGRKSYDPLASQKKREEQIRKYPLMEEIGFLILGMRVYHRASGKYICHERLYGRSLTKETLKTGLARFFHNGEELRKDAISLSIRKIRNILHWFESQKQFNFYASSLLFVYEGSFHKNNAKSRIEALTEQKHAQADSENKSKDHLISSKVNSSCKNTPKSIDYAKGVNGCGSHFQHPQEKGMLVDMKAKTNTMIEGNHPNGGQEDMVEVRMIDFAHVFPSDNSDDGYMFGLRNLIFVLEQILQD